MTFKIFAGAINEAMATLAKKSLNKRYYNDPVLWAKEVLGVHLWSKQRDICYAVRDHKRVAVRSSNGVGKTHVCGVIAAWWIATRYLEDPHQTIVVVTAPSFPQIKTNLFHELNVEMSRSKESKYANGELKGDAFQPLPGKINTSGNVAQWLSSEGAQLAIGRKPAEGDVIRTFAGIHRKNVLFIIDEAGGVSPDMFVSAERLTTNAGAKILIVGNPDRRGSEFYKVFDPKSDWYKIGISAFDTPTHTGEPCPDELLEYMPSPEWVQRNIKAWGGKDDPRVQIAIYGQFPDSDDSVFFSERIINHAEDADITSTLPNPRFWVLIWPCRVRMNLESTSIVVEKFDFLRRGPENLHEKMLRLSLKQSLRRMPMWSTSIRVVSVRRLSSECSNWLRIGMMYSRSN